MNETKCKVCCSKVQISKTSSLIVDISQILELQLTKGLKAVLALSARFGRHTHQFPGLISNGKCSLPMSKHQKNKTH